MQSPDGRFVAFAPSGTREATDVVDASGAGRVRLTSAGAPSDWSPGGRTLALAGPLGEGSGAVRTLDLGDRTAHPFLTPGVSDGVYRSYGLATFSASGRQLLVCTRDQGPDRGDVQDRLRRYDLASGAEDPSPAPLCYGKPADGGGDRAQPPATAPRPVTGLQAAVGPSELRLRYARQTEPDTAGVTVRYAVGSTPPATVTDGLAGPDSLTSTAVVTHLAASTTYSVSVFTRDWSGAASAPATASATTPAQVATALTLDGPDTVTYGNRSPLTGRLVREDTGAAVVGARLVLVGHHEGDPDSVLQEALTTDADGRLAAQRLTSEATRYGVRYAGDGPLLAATASALVRVRPRLTVTVTPGERVPEHSRANVTVTISSAFPGSNVRITQRLYGSGPDVLTRFDRRSQAGIDLATTQRQAAGTNAIAVTPGARRGYVADPAFVDFVIY